MRGFVLCIFFLCGYLGAFILAGSVAVLLLEHPTDAIIESGAISFFAGIVYGALWIWYLTHEKSKGR